jgi:hypothetical protein
MTPFLWKCLSLSQTNFTPFSAASACAWVNVIRFIIHYFRTPFFLFSFFWQIRYFGRTPALFHDEEIEFHQLTGHTKVRTATAERGLDASV